jgi:hypothetical protein
MFVCVAVCVFKCVCCVLKYVFKQIQTDRRCVYVGVYEFMCVSMSVGVCVCVSL